ncbi:MAG: HEPN domain-containing protein [Leptospiraceae bacterium]|nr:HEPN domain-containing protein [Leptospiraceae bacterium]MBL0266509.1 HEPN domain-containing protein [Leptospiraceae bacterium]
MREDENSQVWLRYALSNLERARLGKETENILYSDICFDCQQAAEKSLKAVLVFLKKDFPKTHSIQKLLSLLSDDYQIDDSIRRATLLTDYAVDTRYPIEIGEQPDENDYKEALALAESVYSWAQEKIGLL